MNYNALPADSLKIPICSITADLLVVEYNQPFSDLFNAEPNELTGKTITELLPSLDVLLSSKPNTKNRTHYPKYFKWQQYKAILQPIFQMFSAYIANALDLKVERVTEKTSKQEYFQLRFIPTNTNQDYIDQLQEERNKAYLQLIQTEKLASIGQLSAGIAHEINNPVGFVSSNMQTLSVYFQTIQKSLNNLEKIVSDLGNDKLKQSISEELTGSNFKPIFADISEIIEESLDGTKRITSIVKSLKDLAHANDSERVYTNLANGIDATLKIINNEVKYSIEVEKHYSPDTPKVLCQPVQINQVFMNILINACQAIEDKGSINITVSQFDHDTVQVIIEDDGKGIAPEKIASIYEPFFTTKSIGRGTGLGLSVSRDIIQAHNGDILVESELGKGSKFIVLLPINNGKAE